MILKNPTNTFLSIGLAFILALILISTGSAQENEPYIRRVPSMESDKTGPLNPVGVTFSSQSDHFYVLEAQTKSSSDVIAITPFGNRKNTTRISTTIEDPLNVVFDNLNDRLLAFQPSTAQLVEIRENPSGILEQSIIIRHDINRLEIKDPQGMALDESSGSLFILDRAGPRIVLLQLGPGRSFSGGRLSVIDLSQSGLVAPRGIALDPTTGHLHVFDLIDQSLYELTQTGRVVAIRDMVPFGLKSPQGMVFAPSGDQTDDPNQVSLFLADTGLIPGRGTGSLSSSRSQVLAGAGGVLAKPIASLREAAAYAQESGQILELSLVQPAMAAASNFTSSLVKMTDMSTISPPSPDPSGIAYVPLNNRLIIDDGEVEETVNGITHFQGANVWEMTLAGSLIRTANISNVPPTQVPMSNEPTGVAWNPNNGHYYFSDDSSGIDVYDLDPGPDGLVGTSDDTWSGFDTSFAGNGDAEGIAYDTWNNTLFVADGVNAEVYRYSLTGALISQFDVQAYGVVDPEAVEFNPISGTLFVMSSNRSSPVIVETTTSGALLQTIDISSANIITAAGLAYAPASNGSGTQNFYIVDRGIDNNNDPQVIDGKLFEMSAPASGPTPTPSLTFTPTTTSSGPAVSELRFNPIADAYIQESSPNTNYGSASTLQTDSSPVKHFLIKFNVSGINGRKVTGAQLRLYNTDSSPGGGNFYYASNNTWQEGTVTWNNAPVADPNLLFSLGSVSSGNFYTVDLSSLITGDGIYSLRISSTSSNGADYSSKEGTQPPLLTITFTDGQTPTITPTFIAPNTPTATKTTTNTATFTPTNTATNALITPSFTPTNTVTFTPANTATIPLTLTATKTPTLTATKAPTLTATQTLVSTATSTGLPEATSIYVSFASNGTVDGLSFTDDDILYFNGQNWSMLFDGSDVGLGSVDVFAISVVDSDTILMSLSSAITIGGLAIDPQDIVRFDATSLGNTTAGTFSMYMDGSDVGLSTTSERIDSLSVLPDGRILISTTGSPSVPGVSGRDEDILAFTPVSLGNNTTGSWAMYFDGSDVGLGESSGEDIDGLDVINGKIYLSTTGDFSVNSATGTDEDIFVCAPISLGDSTSCNYSPELFFDGSLWGLSGNDIDGFYLGATNPAPAGSPTPISTNTPAPTNNPTSTPTGTPTKTSTPTPTSPFTSTPTLTKTATNTPLPGNSPTSTPTPTVTLTPANTPTAPAITAYTFTPTDDATVYSASPNTNAGSDTSLEIDASPLKDFMLKFVVSGVNGRTVRNAKLRLYNTNTSPVGGKFHMVGDNNWSEATVTWNTAPAADAQILATLGVVDPGIWYEVDLTTFITGDGTYSLRVTSTSSNGADYSSKEGSFAPELVITVD